MHTQGDPLCVTLFSDVRGSACLKCKLRLITRLVNITKQRNICYFNKAMSFTFKMRARYCQLDIIQLMHSFEVNIRICQLENSDVHRGEAEVKITFEG